MELKTDDKPARFILNPPPSDDKCERCGKHTSELKPFGGEGEFAKALLVKTFRPMYEGVIEEYEVILNEYARNDETKDDNIPFLEEKYGKEKVDYAFRYSEASGCIGASWECKDCITQFGNK